MAEIIDFKRRTILDDVTILIFPPKSTPAPPVVPTEAMAVCREIRRRFDEVRRLVDRELSLENEPGYSAARIVARIAEDQLERFCDQLLKRPISSWDDVVVRAEILRASSEYSLDGLPCWCSPNECPNRDEAMAGQLLAAVVHLGGVGRLAIHD